jgi:hypothetical protein
MPIDFDRWQYIGCIPKRAQPTHPTDQSPCIIRDCPECQEPMWVSQKKRKLEEDNLDSMRVVCLTCLVVEAFYQGLEPEIFSL